MRVWRRRLSKLVVLVNDPMVFDIWSLRKKRVIDSSSKGF